MSHSFKALLLLVCAVSTAFVIAGCVAVTETTHRGGELSRRITALPPDIVRLAKASGCRVAFLPLVQANGTATGAGIDLALANHLLDTGIRKVPVQKGCAVTTTTDAERKLSDAGLVGQYAQLLRDYDRSGLIDEARIRKMGEVLDSDIVAQGQLLELKADLAADNFQSATIRFTAMNAKTGRIGWSVQTTALQNEVDSRFERKAIERDDHDAKVYTGISIGSAIIGLIAYNKKQEELGVALMLPLAGIYFAWMEKSRTTAVDDQQRVNIKRTSVAEGFNMLVDRSIQELIEASEDKTELQDSGAPVAVKAHPTNGPAKAALTGVPAELRERCETACTKIVKWVPGDAEAKLRRVDLCMRRCVTVRGEKFRACIDKATTWQDASVCDDL